MHHIEHLQVERRQKTQGGRVHDKVTVRIVIMIMHIPGAVNRI